MTRPLTQAVLTCKLNPKSLQENIFMSNTTFKPGAVRALFLSTTAFAVSFAIWGLISALAPKFTEIYKLNATEKSILIAIPVLLGSLGRLPAGMLADRFGGRRIFTALLVFSAIPAILVG